MDLYIMLACLWFLLVFLTLIFLGPVTGYITLASKNKIKSLNRN